MKNKKANIPITILVAGVIAVCTLVIISFAFNQNQINESAEILNSINRLIEDKEVVDFYKMHTGFTDGQIYSFIETVISQSNVGGNRIFVLEEVSLPKAKNKYSVKYSFEITK